MSFQKLIFFKSFLPHPKVCPVPKFHAWNIGIILIFHDSDISYNTGLSIQGQDKFLLWAVWVGPESNAENTCIKILLFGPPFTQDAEALANRTTQSMEQRSVHTGCNEDQRICMQIFTLISLRPVWTWFDQYWFQVSWRIFFLLWQFALGPISWSCAKGLRAQAKLAKAPDHHKNDTRRFASSTKPTRKVCKGSRSPQEWHSQICQRQQEISPRSYLCNFDFAFPAFDLFLQLVQICLLRHVLHDVWYSVVLDGGAQLAVYFLRFCSFLETTSIRWLGAMTT